MDELERAQAGEALRVSEEILHAIFKSLPDAITIADLNGYITECNQATLEMHGFSAKEEILGRSAFDLIALQDRQKALDGIKTVLKQGSIRNMEYIFLTKEGREFIGELTAGLIRDHDENPAGFVAVTKNITERKQTEDELLQTASELKAIFRAVPDLFLRFSADGTCQELMAGRSSDLHLTAEEVLGKHFQDVSKKIGQQFQQAIDRVLQTQSPVVIEYPLPLEGETKFFEARFLPLLEDQVAVVVRSITERKLTEERLKYLSFHDIMTGLYNRSYFEEELRRLNTKRQMPLSIIIGDIDGLKLVNDTLGHQKGDKLIIKVARILKASCRVEDIVCRWGGDEFAILLPRTDKNTAETVCERIRKACEKAKGEPIPLSISLGVAVKWDFDQNIEGVLREAEDGMYRKKLLESNSTRFPVVTYFQRALAEKTQDTVEHSRRIQDLVLEMGNTLGLSNTEKDELAILAALHDIGEIAIPENILLKPCGLSLEEWEFMKKHSEIGDSIVKSVPDLITIAEAILSHHERWDGTGYPNGLKGKQIPLISRILAIADAYDAMTNGRPYKEAINHQEAVEEIKRCAGTQFEPELVELFIKTTSLY